MTAPAKITPMFRQYMEIKASQEDAILFYRMGDFYEMFFDDALTASKILGITLTSRNNKGDADKIPMCGVPYHAASGYLARLVKAGHRVAVCEQVEDPKQAKGVVKREVVRVVTPGVTLEEQLLDDKSNRYLAAVCAAAVGRNDRDPVYGISFLDITTGEFLLAERTGLDSLVDELARMSPAELLLDSSRDADNTLMVDRIEALLPGLCITERPGHTFTPHTAREALLDHFNTINLAGFGCEHLATGATAAGALLQYLVETQKTDLAHLDRLTPVELTDLLLIDESSRRNLELTQTLINAKREGSLLALLDRTNTPMGARLLKKRLLFPLRDVSRINARLDAVDVLRRDGGLRQELQDSLAGVHDLERLNSRVVLGSVNGRDLTALKLSLARLPGIKTLLVGQEDGLLHEVNQALDPLTALMEFMDAAIREDAPVTLREGHIIQEGYHQELDEIVAVLRHGKQMILDLEARERQRTGIANLKIGFNKVFGYYLEVSRGRLANVPDYFIRKQTLANAERYITPELKEFEQKVTGARDRRLDLEYELFCSIRNHVAEHSNAILHAALQVARIDFFVSLAEVASRNRYVRPQVDDGDNITIIEGRHPVIEQALPPGHFVPNDIRLDQSSEEMLIITGPNMAGKSTVLRQTAHIVLMAQMGSLVPADEAHVGVVDRIFTRVGAMDDLRRGQSTFMVEMNETANILHNATPKSLVVLDEIGRGTSTFDGLAIAWAVTEDLVNKEGKGVKTLFATHYHELVELALTHDRVRNYHIGVREWNDTIVFLHKLMPGGTNRSYGIEVAALAGVPARVVDRAKEILRNIEQGEFNHQGEPRIAAGRDKRKAPAGPMPPSQLPLFAGPDDPLRQRLKEVQPDGMTPIDALMMLYELKKLS